MKEQLEESKKEDPRLKVKDLILSINKKGLTFNRIAKIIKFSYDSVMKWKKGVFPRENKLKIVVERLEKLLEDLESGEFVNELSVESIAKDLKQGIPKMNSSPVIIYFDLGEKTEPSAEGSGNIGAIVKQNGKEGIIAYKNDSNQFGDADGLIYLDDPSQDPYIKTGWIIAIKKIDKMEWDPGYYYYIIGIGNRYLRRVFEEQGEYKEDKKVKLVSQDENRFPAITLSLNKIKAIFKVEKIIFKPE